jgi:hypothetical protein
MISVRCITWKSHAAFHIPTVWQLILNWNKTKGFKLRKQQQKTKYSVASALQLYAMEAYRSSGSKLYAFLPSGLDRGEQGSGNITKLNVVVQWLTFLLRIWEVLG